MDNETIKNLGIIGGLIFSSFGLILNAIASFKNNNSRKLQSYQEITKSHRELWKLTLDNPEKYIRIFEINPKTNEKPITYEEQRFVHLILLHMTSAHNFSKSNHIMKIEKLKFDFDDFLSYPIPRNIWNSSKKFFNKDFIKFVDSPVNTNSLSSLFKLKQAYNLVYSRRWRILLLTSFSEKLIKTISEFDDEFIIRTKEDETISKQFIKLNKIDFIISFEYGKIFSKEILKIVPAINLHGGYLPYNKGSNPDLWSWLDNTPRGVTIHYINEEIDTGDIIFQKQLTKNSDHKKTLQSSFDESIIECSELFKEIWPLIRAGKNKRIKQTEAGTSHTIASQNSFSELFDDEGLNVPIQKFIEKAKELMNREKPHSTETISKKQE